MVGGYMISNILSSGVEASIFAYAMGAGLRTANPELFLDRARKCDHPDRKFKRCRYVCEDSGSCGFTYY